MTRHSNEPTPDHVGIAALAAIKASGVELCSSTMALDRAIMTVRFAIEGVMSVINSGLVGEPTSEDRQRMHELQALLEDLPKVTNDKPWETKP